MVAALSLGMWAVMYRECAAMNTEYWSIHTSAVLRALVDQNLVITALSGERITTEKPLARQDVWMNPWLAELFVKWLDDGPTPPNSLEDNLQCCALLFAAIESAHTRQIVDVQTFLRTYLQSHP